MKRIKRAFSRRAFLGTTAGLAATTQMGSITRAEKQNSPTSTVLDKTCWLGDKFLQWQNPYGRFANERTPASINDGKFFVLCYISSAMYRASEFAECEAYKQAADRYWVFYLAAVGNRRPELGGQFTAARAGIGLIPYQDFKRHNPKEGKLDDAANSIYARLLEYRWDKGSYFRNGYPGGSMKDAANSDDNAAVGCGLMSYYAVTEKPEVLAHAEGLADYFLTECTPMTYEGVWSSENNNWVVAPTDNAYFEHFRRPASEVSWAWTSIEAVLYLTQLYAATNKDELKQAIRNKCVTAMKWQFDACQFEDGACGMSGRDDKWIGITAGAILSYLRVRDAGFLTEDEIEAYRPKALAAKDWMFARLGPECLSQGGYWKVTGKSEPRPKCNLAWLFGWTLQALTRSPQI